MSPREEEGRSRASHDGARTVRILVAEDEGPVRRSIARWLRREGFEIIEAEDGVQAVRLAGERHPDLAIVDLGLPFVDGFEVVKILKEARGAALPVLVLSGFVEPETRVQAFDVGADDFIPKPVHMPELLRRIDTFHRTFKAYAEEHKARERAERLRLYAAEASALLAHDLNNGLATAMGNLQFVAEVVKVEGEPKEALEASLRALKRMCSLVKNFVDIGRLEDAALTPNREDVSVYELLDAMRGIHEASLAAEGKRILVDCPEDLHANVDPVLVERVLHNLVGNATRYVSAKGTIRLKARPEGDGVIIEVGNTGPRLPEHLQHVLFEKYRTGGDGKSMRGMGLYFCRLACEAHGGSIRVASTDDMDVNFVASFPGPA